MSPKIPEHFEITPAPAPRFQVASPTSVVDAVTFERASAEREERQRFGYRAPEDRGAASGVGGSHFSPEAQWDKSSPSDDLAAMLGASSTPPERVFADRKTAEALGYEVLTDPAGPCGCEQSVSLAERAKLLETLLWDLSVVAGFKGAHVERGIVEHVRRLAANFRELDRSEEIASLTRALKAERAAALDATHKAARLTLHNRMLLGLVETLAAAPPRKLPSALARARSLCAEGLEFAWVVGGIGTLVAVYKAEALGEAALRKLSDSLGWAAVGTY